MNERTRNSDASFAALAQQVAGIESDYRELKGAVVSLGAEFRSSFSTLAAKLDDKAQTPWTVIFSGLGLILTVFTSIGVLAYLPVKNAIDDLKSETRLAREQIVPRVEHEQRWRVSDRDSSRMIERYDRMNVEMDSIRSQVDYLRGRLDVPR